MSGKRILQGLVAGLILSEVILAADDEAERFDEDYWVWFGIFGGVTALTGGPFRLIEGE